MTLAEREAELEAMRLHLAKLRQMTEDLPLLSTTTMDAAAAAGKGDLAGCVKTLCAVVLKIAHYSTEAQCTEIISHLRELVQNIERGLMFGDPDNDLTPKPGEAAH